MDGKVRVADDPRFDEGYKIKYWTGLSNFEQVCEPQAIPFPLPMLGKAV